MRAISLVLRGLAHAVASLMRFPLAGFSQPGVLIAFSGLLFFSPPRNQDAYQVKFEPGCWHFVLGGHGGGAGGILLLGSGPGGVLADVSAAHADRVVLPGVWFDAGFASIGARTGSPSVRVEPAGGDVVAGDRVFDVAPRAGDDQAGVGLGFVGHDRGVWSVAECSVASVHAASTVNANGNQEQEEKRMSEGKPAGAEKKVVAGILGVLLGAWGIHKFYLGYTKEGVIQIVITICTCGIGGVIGFIEGIMYLIKSDEEFVATYITGKKGWF
jgi:TM2 domain-containing membrane protein YozV